MTRKKARSLRCPTCRKIMLAGDPEFPFCSDRCRLIDLGRWVSGGYVISAPLNDPESGGEAAYNEPGYNEKTERRIGGVRKGPEASGPVRQSPAIQHPSERPAHESEKHGRRKLN